MAPSQQPWQGVLLSPSKEKKTKVLTPELVRIVTRTGSGNKQVPQFLSKDDVFNGFKAC